MGDGDNVVKGVGATGTFENGCIGLSDEESGALDALEHDAQLPPQHPWSP